MKKIPLLPKWILPDTFPSVYDTTSGSWIEMASKLYGAMRTLQIEYNSFVDEINKTLTDFINDVNQDQECFEKRMTKVIHDYIDYMDTKIKTQDKQVAEAVSYMTTNLSNSITELLTQMKESGELDTAIANAFDSMSTELTALKTNISSIESDISLIKENINALEKQQTYFDLNETTEELTLIINEKGGDE